MVRSLQLWKELDAFQAGGPVFSGRAQKEEEVEPGSCSSPSVGFRAAGRILGVLFIWAQEGAQPWYTGEGFGSHLWKQNQRNKECLWEVILENAGRRIGGGGETGKGRTGEGAGCHGGHWRAQSGGIMGNRDKYLRVLLKRQRSWGVQSLVGGAVGVKSVA